MATTYTLVSWAALICFGVVMYYVSYVKPAQARRPSIAKVTLNFLEKKKEPKKAKRIQKDEPVKEKDLKPEAAKFTSESQENKEQNETNDKDFALHALKAQNGTIGAPKSQDGGRQRSIKQAKLQEKPTTVETSSDNGTGADADDDRSSVNSPELEATTATNGDVADMLEAKASGPSILRVTPPVNPTTTKKATAPATFEVAETKKQRQNRQKAEAKKQAREEDEKERKVLMEKQRRTAREAEGRAAKDGSIFMAAKAPSSSAWTVTNGSQSEAPKAELLDTYTPQVSTPHESARSESSSDWQKVAHEMSEEEQMRRLEDEDSWKTVAKPKRAKRAPQSASPTKDSNDESSDYAPAVRAPVQKENVKPKENTKPQKFHGLEVERETEIPDSEWEVA